MTDPTLPQALARAEALLQRAYAAGMPADGRGLQVGMWVAMPDGAVLRVDVEMTPRKPQ